MAEYIRLNGIYRKQGDVLTKEASISEETDPMRMALRVANRKDERKQTIYCEERVEELLRQQVRANSSWEDMITIDELIKKGALVPSPNAPAI